MLRIGFGVVVLAVVLLGATRVPAPDADTTALLARSDAAFARRGDGHEGARARPAPIRRAIAEAQAVLAADPSSLAARWRLLRALSFEGDFAAADAAEKREAFDRAAKLSAESLTMLDRRLGGDRGLAGMLRPTTGVVEAPSETSAMRTALKREGIDVGDAARLHFWSATAWEGWSQVHGQLGAVRQGVAQRIYESARVTAALDPELAEGGSFRLISRLHARLPKLSLLSPWVDRDLAIPYAEHAMSIDPTFPGNRLMLGLTLLTLAPARRVEAIGLLRQVADLEPDPSRVVEELAMRKAARERLAGQPGPTVPAHPTGRRKPAPLVH